MARHLSVPSFLPLLLTRPTAGRRLSARSPAAAFPSQLAGSPSMATAEAGDGREPLGLGSKRTRRSMATPETRDMAAASAAGGELEREGPVLYVLALPVALPLPVAVSRMDAAVPRKARTSGPRAKPSGWWAFRLPVPRPEEHKNPPEEARLPVPPPEEARPRRPQRLRVRLRVSPPPDLDAASPAMKKKKKPAKRARRCLQCGSAETPQWRSGPMGRSTLCNACGVRLRAAGALRETEHRTPPPAIARTVPEPPPRPVSPASDFPPDSQIWEPQAPLPDVYLVRKPSKRRRLPRKEAASAPAVYLVKKKKPSKKPWRPRNTGRRCLHCGSTSTPQWREGPMGRHTLCNACGVRYRQGRLLPEYRPAASPTFVPSEHANRHREVLQLHRQRQGKNHRPPPPEQQRHNGNGDSADAPERDGDDLIDELHLRRHRQDEYPPTPLHRPLPQPVDDCLAGDQRVGGNNDSADALAGCGGGNDQTDMPSSLDSLLLDGPSAPLIVDGDKFLVS